MRISVERTTLRGDLVLKGAQKTQIVNLSYNE